MDRFEAMTVFVAVTESESLSATSRKLKIPLATVSRKITELEAHLGVRLLNRSTRGLELTEIGRAYLESCKRILEDLGETERSAMGEYSTPKGDLTVTAPIVFGRIHVLPLVTTFLKSYPDINIRLLLTDRSTNMLEEHIDAAIRIGELADSSLIATKIGAVRRITCASPAYLASRKTPKTPRDLKSHNCISNEAFDASTNWIFYDQKSKMPVTINPRLSVTTAESAIDAAISGLGITRALSYQSAKAVEDKRLKIILEKFEPPASPIHLVHQGGRALPQKLRTFKDFIVPQLKESLY